MADNDTLHTTEILKAALPFLDNRTQTTMDLLIKFMDLMGTLKNVRNYRPVVHATEEEPHKVDLESMLQKIKPACGDRERPFIDKILSLFQAKRMMEMYNNYMSIMKTMQETNESPDDSTNFDSINKAFSGYDFSSFFGSNEESNSTGNTDDDYNFDSDVNISTIFGTEDSIPKHISPEDMTEDDQFKDHQYIPPTTDEINSAGETINQPNNMMMNMLKTMLPPEQIGTYENLMMLFNSMSNQIDNGEQDKE